MANLARLFFALWYLGGCLIHVVLGLTNGHAYAVFGDTMLLPAGRRLWKTAVMPNITTFALLLALFELATGLLILGRGRTVKYGLTASVLFNLYLVQQGLGSPQQRIVADVLTNRLASFVFAAAQLPLFRVRYDETFWQGLGRLGRQLASLPHQGHFLGT